MKNTLLYQSALLLAFLMTVFGCNKPPEFPNEPHISFKGFESYQASNKGGRFDSLIIITRFEDGDGDLGLSAADIQLPPYNQDNNRFNYLLETFVQRKEDQAFAKYDALAENGQFFRLSPDNRVGPLEGDLRFSYRIPTPNVFNIKSGDLIKFRLRIRDRALNFSNTIDTEAHEILFP